MAKVQVPSIGRIVSYAAYGTPGGEYPAGVKRAAIITEVAPALEDGRPDLLVGLCVLNPTGMFFNRGVPYHETEPGCWSWPVFVPPVDVPDEA